MGRLLSDISDIKYRWTKYTELYSDTNNAKDSHGSVEDAVILHASVTVFSIVIVTVLVLLNVDFLKRKLRLPEHQISWVSEYAIFLCGLAQQWRP